jgi:hypothetical protein
LAAVGEQLFFLRMMASADISEVEKLKRRLGSRARKPAGGCASAAILQGRFFGGKKPKAQNVPQAKDSWSGFSTLQHTQGRGLGSVHM